MLLRRYGGELRPPREAVDEDTRRLRKLLIEIKGICEVGADVFCREAQLA